MALSTDGANIPAAAGDASPALFSPISLTDDPRSATPIAAARPINPPPTTITSALSLFAPIETGRESVA
jgi:hypothetical protein